MAKTMEGGVKTNNDEGHNPSDINKNKKPQNNNKCNTPKKGNKAEGSPIKSPVKSPSKSPVKSPIKLLASEVWTCEICKADSQDDDPKARVKWIECDRCSARFHQNCSDLNVKQWRFINSFPQKNLEWICCTCLENKSKETSKQEDQREPDCSDVKQLKEQNKQIIQQNSIIIKQNSKILDMLSKRKPDKEIDEQIKKHVEESIQNQREREEKKNNLILFGVAEGTGKDEEEDKVEDVKTTTKVLTYVNPEVKITLDPSKINRIGRRKDKNKPRPIKVELDSSDTKMKYIRNAKKLKDHDTFKKVGLSFDKTKREQEEYRRLKDQLDEKNKSSGTGQDYQLFRGKVLLKTEVANIIRKYNESKGTGWSSENSPDGGNSKGLEDKKTNGVVKHAEEVSDTTQ